MARLGCSPDAIDEFGERIEDTTTREAFLENLQKCYTDSVAHDSLVFGGGLTRSAVFAWKIMEYLPFRRMDLQDGQWKAIRWYVTNPT